MKARLTAIRGQPTRKDSPLGRIPRSWPIVRLADIALKIKAGATPTGGGQAYQATRTRFALIRSQNVYDRRFTHEGLAFISDKQASELAGSEVQAKDLLLNITGDGTTFARAAMAPADALPACVNQHVMIIRPDSERCDPGFLLSYLTHPLIKAYIESFNAGGSRRAITKGHISSFEIPLPPIAEQRAIARVLGDLDDKIELNRRMNATLEAMAQTLFAETFPYLPGDDLPRGWSSSTIGEEVVVCGGGTPSTTNPEFWTDGNILWATPRDLSALESPIILDTERKITNLGLDQITSQLLPRGTVLLSSRAPIGYLAIAEEPLAINQGFIAMICNARLSNHYVRIWASRNHEAIIARANGTTFPEISKSGFRPLPIIVPPEQVLSDFNQRIDPLHQSIVRNLRENHSLTQLRDHLMPRLLNGELRLDGMKGSS